MECNRKSKPIMYNYVPPSKKSVVFLTTLFKNKTQLEGVLCNLRNMRNMSGAIWVYVNISVNCQLTF